VLELPISLGDEVHPVEQVKLRRLGVGGSLPSREDPLQASGGGQGDRAADLQEGSTVSARDWGRLVPGGRH